jgi:hypothetical protein
LVRAVAIRSSTIVSMVSAGRQPSARSAAATLTRQSREIMLTGASRGSGLELRRVAGRRSFTISIDSWAVAEPLLTS